MKSTSAIVCVVNVFVDSLAQSDRVPPTKELDADIEYASCKNPIVKKLTIWRNKTYAHRDAQIALGGKRILESNSISGVEIMDLFDQSFKIFNRYSSLYRLRVGRGKLLVTTTISRFQIPSPRTGEIG